MGMYYVWADMWVCIDMCDYIIYICTYFYIYIFKKNFLNIYLNIAVYVRVCVYT